MKVLLVDDDTIFRKRVRRGLEQHAISVDEAGCVDEARNLLLGNEYAACLVDLKMPGENGLQLVGEIKAAQPGVRTILFTGFGSANTVANAFKLGAVDFLSKPASIAEILRAIHGDVLGEAEQLSHKAEYPTLVEVEKNYLNQVLIECGGNISRAAKFLGLHRRSLQRKLGKADE